MPFEIITVRETLVSAFGFTIVDADLDFVFDPDTCSFQFARSTLNRDGNKLLGPASITSYRWFSSEPRKLRSVNRPPIRAGRSSP